jgi:hypothetical protein
MPTSTPVADSLLALLADLGFDTGPDSGTEIMINTFDQWSNGHGTHTTRVCSSGISLNEPAKAA